MKLYLAYSLSTIANKWFENAKQRKHRAPSLHCCRMGLMVENNGFAQAVISKHVVKRQLLLLVAAAAAAWFRGTARRVKDCRC